MKKSIQLMKEKNVLKEKITNLMEEGKTQEAHSLLGELDNLSKEIEIVATMEAEEMEQVANCGEKILFGVEVDPNVVFNKQLLGKPLNEEERNYIENAAGTPGQIEHDEERGGVLVPEQAERQLKELRRDYTSLKSYCNVINAVTMKGKFPIATEQTGKLIAFDELTELQKSQITFKQSSWEVKDYGDIIPVSNTLLEDARINLIDYIGRQFIKKAVNTENEEILKVLKTVVASNTVAGKGLDDITTVLNVKLPSAIKKTAKIYTNQSGFDYLDRLSDKNGHPLLTVSYQDEAMKLLKGKEVVVVDDVLLPNNGKKVPFYVGDLSQAINFFDRHGVEVAVSEHAGFTQNATLLRAVERFDVKIFDDKAMYLVEIDPSTAA